MMTCVKPFLVDTGIALTLVFDALICLTMDANDGVNLHTIMIVFIMFQLYFRSEDGFYFFSKPHITNRNVYLTNLVRKKQWGHV